MKKLTSSLCLLLLLVSCRLCAAPAGEPTLVRLSHPDQPAVVRVYVAQGTVKLVGSDVLDTVTIASDSEPEEKSVTRPDGLRVLSSSASFSFTEKDNVVELNYGRGGMPGGPEANFVVTVPRNASVEVHDGWNTEISAENLTGDIEIKNLNGGISLSHLGGGAVVETMNGEIKASFDNVAPGKALSFTSMNGPVELRLPAETKANVRFRTQNGSILTDFPEDSLKTKTEQSRWGHTRVAHSEAARIAGDAAREAARVAREVAEEVRDAIRDDGNGDASKGGAGAGDMPRPPRAPRPPSIPAIAGGKVVSGVLNGGGADVQVATMNGDIVVRRTDAEAK